MLTKKNKKIHFKILFSHARWYHPTFHIGNLLFFYKYCQFIFFKYRYYEYVEKQNWWKNTRLLKYNEYSERENMMLQNIPIFLYKKHKENDILSLKNRFDQYHWYLSHSLDHIMVIRMRWEQVLEVKNGSFTLILNTRK